MNSNGNDGDTLKLRIQKYRWGKKERKKENLNINQN